MSWRELPTAKLVTKLQGHEDLISKITHTYTTSIQCGRPDSAEVLHKLLMGLIAERAQMISDLQKAVAK
jgi:hypothetical protein